MMNIFLRSSCCP